MPPLERQRPTFRQRPCLRSLRRAVRPPEDKVVCRIAGVALTLWDMLRCMNANFGKLLRALASPQRTSSNGCACPSKPVETKHVVFQAEPEAGKYFSIFSKR